LIVLVVGLGGIGQRHMRNMRALFGPDIEILGYDPRPQIAVLTDRLTVEEGSRLEEKYKIHRYPDFDSALAQKPNVVFVCNPSSLHVGTALRAAQSGCHLFIEKPLSHTNDHVEELVGLVEKRNLVATVGFQLRFHPCLRRLHSLLKENVVGRVLAVRAEVGEYLPKWHAYEDYRQIYASKRELGGGVILSQIHEMDYLYWLFGLPKHLYALGGHLSSLELDVEDVASILMECSVDGRMVPVHLHQDYVQRPSSRTCQIVGDEGKILVDIGSLSVTVFDRLGSLKESSTYAGFERNQLFLDEIKNFFDRILGKPTPIVSLRDGAQSLRMALAAKSSLQTGQIITLNG
jgi:predicted dehydrogenase